MGLLADIYSTGDGLKRRFQGLLDDPGGTVAQMVGRMGDDQNGLLNLQANAYPMRGDRTVLNSPQQISQFRKELANKGAEQAMAAATVWHGSPHKFDKFDSSKIGTGEGAQAYGHGLYLADQQSIAQGYKDALTPRTGMWDASVDGKSLFDAAADHGTTGYASAFAQKYFDLVKNGKTENQAKQQISSQLQKRITAGKSPGDVKGAQEAFDFIGKAKINMPEGSLYKVDLPDEYISRMLDWDKPLSQQAPEVQAIAQNLMKNGTQNQFGWLSNADSPGDISMTGKQFLNSLQGGEAQMQKAGIPGIRYLDGGSRRAGQGSSNYVIFPQNEGLLKILERNGQPIK